MFRSRHLFPALKQLTGARRFSTVAEDNLAIERLKKLRFPILPSDPYVGQQLPTYNLKAEKVGNINLPKDVFEVPVRTDIIHKNVRYYMAKRRQGTHRTKTRSEVSGGGRKPRPQKGSGRARQSSIRAPHYRGGGIVHGPVLRSHAHKLNKKVRRLGLKCALSARARERKIIVLDNIKLEEVKARHMASALDTFKKILHARTPSFLLLIDHSIDKTERARLKQAASNINYCFISNAANVSVYNIIRYRHLIMTKEAVESITTRLRTPVFRGPLSRRKWAATLKLAEYRRSLENESLSDRDIKQEVKDALTEHDLPDDEVEDPEEAFDEDEKST